MFRLFRFFFTLLMLTLSISAQAMDAEKLKAEGFVFFNDDIVKDPMSMMPKNGPWSIGQSHCFFAFAWASKNKIPEQALVVDNVLGFKIYAPPFELEEYLNDNLYETNFKGAYKGFGHDTTTNILFQVIKEQIDNKKPILAYYLSESINLSTIVGYKVGNPDSVLLLLIEDQALNHQIGLYALPIEQFRNNIDLNGTISSFNKRWSSILELQLITQLQAFNFILFSDRSSDEQSDDDFLSSSDDESYSASTDKEVPTVKANAEPSTAPWKWPSFQNLPFVKSFAASINN